MRPDSSKTVKGTHCRQGHLDDGSGCQPGSSRGRLVPASALGGRAQGRGRADCPGSVHPAAGRQTAGSRQADGRHRGPRRTQGPEEVPVGVPRVPKEIRAPGKARSGRPPGRDRDAGGGDVLGGSAHRKGWEVPSTGKGGRMRCGGPSELGGAWAADREGELSRRAPQNRRPQMRLKVPRGSGSRTDGLGPGLREGSESRVAVGTLGS